MKALHDYKAAIFDLDGTLIDSMQVWDHICRDWLLGQGKTPAPTLERDLELMTLGQSAQYVISTYNIALTPTQIIDEWQQMALQQYQDTVKLKDGAAELLQELAARGLKLALATSCFPAACEAVLRRYNLWELFAVAIYSDEVAKDKTHADIWLACAERLNILPQDCIVFEDLPAAGQGIRAAGMAFAAVYDASCKDWQLLKSKADIAVFSLRELCAAGMVVSGAKETCH